MRNVLFFLVYMSVGSETLCGSRLGPQIVASRVTSVGGLDRAFPPRIVAPVQAAFVLLPGHKIPTCSNHLGMV